MSNPALEDDRPLILVVDDDPAMRLLLRRVMAREGYQVAEATDGAECLVAFAHLHPDIVLLDGLMAGMDGFEACAQLQAAPDGSQTPVLLITSLDDTASVDHAFEVGASDYVTKPIHWAVLRQRVRRLLRTRQAEQVLRESEAHFRAVVNTAFDGIITMTPTGIIRSFNHGAERIYAYSAAEAIGQPVTLLVPDRLRDPSPARFGGLVGSEDDILGRIVEGIGQRKGGVEFPLELVITALQAETGTLFTGIVRDTTERKAFEERLTFLGLHDSLTNLPNRACFMERLTTALAHTARGRGASAVLFLDLDHFKAINDSLGHKAGDQLLTEVGLRLQASVRAGDMVARLGGDEFTLLLEELTNQSDAIRVAERVAEQLRMPINLEGHDVRITISVGIAFSTTGQACPSELLRCADLAMYEAKHNGKAHYAVFDPSMHARARERLDVDQRAGKLGGLSFR